MMILAIIIICIMAFPLGMLIWRQFAIHYKWADTKFIRNFCCERFGHWHGPTTTTGFDGCSKEGKCQWCGYQGLFDSNGDLF